MPKRIAPKGILKKGMPKRIPPKGILKKGGLQPLKRVQKRVSLNTIYIGRKYFPVGYPGVYRDDTQWLNDIVTHSDEASLEEASLEEASLSHSFEEVTLEEASVSSFLARCVIC
jgi:hypothetical protein